LVGGLYKLWNYKHHWQYWGMRKEDGTVRYLENPSGMFGHDSEGVIWEDPQGNYYEWHFGPYFVSSVPLKLEGNSLTMNIDYDLQKKEVAVENGNGNVSSLY
jgi:hypothetical protein